MGHDQIVGFVTQVQHVVGALLCRQGRNPVHIDIEACSARLVGATQA